MNEFLLIAGMMLVTFGVRYPVLAVLSKTPLPEPVFKALRFVPPAVLTAIIVPAVLMPQGELSIEFSNAFLAASLFAVLVSRLQQRGVRLQQRSDEGEVSGLRGLVDLRGNRDRRGGVKRGQDNHHRAYGDLR